MLPCVHTVHARNFKEKKSSDSVEEWTSKKKSLRFFEEYRTAVVGRLLCHIPHQPCERTWLEPGK